jgi:MFS family permease
MVLRILFGAVFGALFGYVLGWFIELFPGFNAAILDGLRVVTGIDGVTMMALLAGIGFLGGIVLGLISSVLHGMRHHWYKDRCKDWYWDWRRDWM